MPEDVPVPLELLPLAFAPELFVAPEVLVTLLELGAPTAELVLFVSLALELDLTLGELG